MAGIQDPMKAGSVTDLLKFQTARAPKVHPEAIQSVAADQEVLEALLTPSQSSAQKETYERMHVNNANDPVNPYAGYMNQGNVLSSAAIEDSEDTSVHSVSEDRDSLKKSLEDEKQRREAERIYRTIITGGLIFSTFSLLIFIIIRFF